MSNQAPPPTLAEQAKLLEDSLQVIRQQQLLMRKCLDSKGKLMDALKHASTFLAELRTSLLTPKQYYELYIAIFDALSYLGSYLRENHPNNHLADLYELVQYAGNIVPRLYLMITVGTAYMSVPEAPLKEIMKDMMEMCRGVQYPIRGLFLRYYLSQRTRDLLPTGSGDSLEGNLQDSLSFVLTNFVEMNKLWVRLQHQGHSRERDKRTRERKELKILVGSNLVRISQLEGFDKNYYKKSILPLILEQVIQCRDVIAQEYLLDVVIQVFPDELHLYTLDELLDATTKLNPQVSLKKILIALFDRLTAYAAREAESSTENAVEKITTALEKVDVSKDQTNETEKELTTEPLNVTPDENNKSENDTPKENDSITETEESGNGDNITPQQPETEVKSESESKPEEEKENEDEDETEMANEDKPPKVSVVRGIPINIDLFDIFWNHLQSLFESRPDISIKDITAILESLCRLSLHCYPENLDNIDLIFEYTNKKVTELKDSVDLYSQVCIDNLLALLLDPINFFPKITNILSFKNYIPLLWSQSTTIQKSIANAVINSLLINNTIITTVEYTEGVFSLLQVLIKDEGNEETGPLAVESSKRNSINKSTFYGNNGTLEGEESKVYPVSVINNQEKVARVIHLLYNEDPTITAKLLNAAKKSLAKGGNKVKFTYPALVTNSLKLIRRYKLNSKIDSEWRQKVGSTFKFLQRIIHDIYKAGKAETALRLYVSAAQIADQVEAEEASYEFFAQAFSIYEESIPDSRSQYQSICVISGALQTARNFNKENYDTLITKCTLYGSKLLKKPDQCRAVYLASHLWWGVEIPTNSNNNNEDDDEEEEQITVLYRDDKRVLECLQRALRVADACMDMTVSIELFVEILNQCLYYFSNGNESVNVKYINGLIELIQTNLNNNADEGLSDSPKKHFERTIDYINRQKELDSRFQEIVC